MAARFAADSMLGSLARKLRLYGFDVVYSSDADDSLLLKLCQEERRTLLTSDRQLHFLALRRGAQTVLITSKGDVNMVTQVFRALKLDPSLSPAMSRCPLCNGEIKEISKGDAAPFVKQGVLSHHNSFYQCDSCQQVYWEGGHWFNLVLFEREVREALKQ